MMIFILIVSVKDNYNARESDLDVINDTLFDLITDRIIEKDSNNTICKQKSWIVINDSSQKSKNRYLCTNNRRMYIAEFLGNNNWRRTNGKQQNL